MATTGVRRRRNGFTLVELLVVIAIMGVLAGMLMGGVMKARAASDRIYCANNLRNLGIGLRVESDAVGGVYPKLANFKNINPTGLQTLRDLLGSKTDGTGKQFQCPLDRVYYPKYGNSYEYNVRDLNNLGGRGPSVETSVEQVAAKKKISADRVWILEDFDSVHAPPLTGKGRNVLYGDGHVSSTDGVNGALPGR